jgi:hypothetical protein
MLDSMIKLMETIVAMEDLGKIDTEGNGINLADITGTRIWYDESGRHEEKFLKRNYTEWLADLELKNKESEGVIQAAME